MERDRESVAMVKKTPCPSDFDSRSRDIIYTIVCDPPSPTPFSPLFAQLFLFSLLSLPGPSSTYERTDPTVPMNFHAQIVAVSWQLDLDRELCTQRAGWAKNFLPPCIFFSNETLNFINSKLNSSSNVICYYL